MTVKKGKARAKPRCPKCGRPLERNMRVDDFIAGKDAWVLTCFKPNGGCGFEKTEGDKDA